MCNRYFCVHVQNVVEPENCLLAVLYCETANFSLSTDVVVSHSDGRLCCDFWFSVSALSRRRFVLPYNSQSLFECRSIIRKITKSYIVVRILLMASRYCFGQVLLHFCLSTCNKSLLKHEWSSLLRL